MKDSPGDKCCFLTEEKEEKHKLEKCDAANENRELTSLLEEKLECREFVQIGSR